MGQHTSTPQLPVEEQHETPTGRRLRRHRGDDADSRGVHRHEQRGSVADFAVSDDGPYTRHDGGSDQAIAHCGNSATDPAPDNVANDGDVDSNDGGNRRQGNEPTIAIDPTNPDVIVAGWNDYCMTDLAAGWMGWASRPTAAAPGSTRHSPATRSTTPPRGWSRRSRAAPTQGTRWSPSTTTADSSWAESRSTASCRRTAPSSWRPTRPTRVHPARPASSQGLRPHPDHRQGRGAAFAGIFQDKPLMEVDRSTASPHEDNVYFCWTKFQGNGRTKIYFSRSTDHGATFERSEIVSDGSVQGCDIAVEHDGDVYVSWHSFPGIAQEREGMKVVRSTDGGLTFSKPRQIATFTAYFPNIGKSRLR